jgi:ubiquinone/menaquinone biosynthesis C-methylase UbiE
MKSRGEKHYIKMPRLAARLYDKLTSVKGMNKSFEEIADFLEGVINKGKLLDVGMGTGRLLKRIHKIIPQIDLYGLDISSAMLDLSTYHLRNLRNVFLRIGTIEKTEYQSNFFDCIVSTGSFYNWDNPIAGLNEIHRILKQGKTAFIYESIRDHDRELLQSRLNDNLQGYNILRRIMSKYFLMKQLRMTYSTSEFNEILQQCAFKDSYKIERIELGNLPIYIRLELQKH